MVDGEMVEELGFDGPASVEETTGGGGGEELVLLVNEVIEFFSEAAVKGEGQVIEVKVLQREGSGFGGEEKDGDSGDGVENISFYVGDGDGGGGSEGHGRVMDEDETARGGGEGVEEGSEREFEMERSVEGGLEVGGEVGGSGRRSGSGRWGRVGREREVMEVDVGEGSGGSGTGNDLVDVGSGAYVVNGEAMRGEVVREVEECIEMALSKERD